ncbi:hypothetical protein TNCV_801411 [Trichonephila clavipes]|nr:hypothetical protein TNCV_801411 [Trichonephila clavipes]
MGTVIGNTLSSILHRHENIKEPMAHMFQWITLEKGIKHGRTLDQENERRILESQKHSAAPYRRIPIAASNFDAQFPPQRARRHLSSDDSNLYLDLILPIAPKPNRHSRDLLHAV